MDEIKSKKEEKCRRRNKAKPICRETGDHVHYPPPTRRTKQKRPRHAPSLILESISRLTPKSRYGECRKNQAADVGTTAYDGCGEFVSATAGEDSWNCAACGCHRSFHREESLSDDGVPKTILKVLKISSSRFRQIFFSPYGDRKTEGKKKKKEIDRSYGGDLSEDEARRVKRFKKKYTGEQTEKMRSYAEKLRWKLSTESREEVEEFCVKIGVTRENFRVWMNNHNSGDLVEKKEEEEGRVKRFKTKFTVEQTEKMRNYAEKLRWKMSPESREEVEAFCIEIGVNRKKFMIWMNNHKERQ